MPRKSKPFIGTEHLKSDGKLPSRYPTRGVVLLSLGGSHPLHVAGHTRTGATSIERRSPIDTRVVVARVASASDADVRDLLPKFHEMAKEANRDPATLSIPIWGSKEDEGELKRDQELGVERVVVSLESDKADKILPELDRWAKFIPKLSGRQD